MQLGRVLVPLWFCAVACEGNGVDPPVSESRGPNAAEAPSVVDAGPPDAAPVAEPDAAAPDAAPPTAPTPACATPPVETFAGTASRKATNYPDNITATVTWQRVATEGCLDRYAPSGTAQYQFAIPGALCSQSVAPDSAPIGADHGTLTVDRTASPAHYQGSGATTWTVTWTCVESGGTVNTQTFEAGKEWLGAEGDVVDGVIAGERVVEDGTQCGNGNSSLPCTYAWSFTAAP